jgi:pimeloyl-ACP methyl ester carboxylesterase
VRRLAVLLAFFAFAGPAAACPADHLRWVRGAGECLAIHTAGRRGAEPPVLMVWLHGDDSRGGASDYLRPRAAQYADDGVVVVTLIRPGYFDGDGNRSTGTSYRDKGDGYPPEVVDAVADAVADLKAFHGAGKVVLVGASGGAAIAGVILGRHPDLADAAVLAGCPCDVQGWRGLLGRGNWRRSLSPHAFADKVPPDTYVVLVTGSDDTNTFPVLAEDYARRLRAQGVAAEFIPSPGGTHVTSARSREFYRAVNRAMRHVRPGWRLP